MQTHPTNPNRLDILGARKSNQEIFHSSTKRWRERLGFCSLVAEVPAVVASNLPAVPSAEAANAKTTIPGRNSRPTESLKLTASQRALLKRQSNFRLPFQNGNLAIVPTIAGVDECPGAPIPGGTYTVASPLVISGDTTGANNTV